MIGPDDKPIATIKGHKSEITDCNLSIGSDHIASTDVEGNIIITKIDD